MNKYIIGAILSIAIIGFMSVEKAQALDCGDTISVDTTLTKNLGPCPGDGLIIDTNDVTLDLNNKKIRGSGVCPAPDCFTGAFIQVGNGVTVLPGVTGVTIKNGTIQDSFRRGIDIRAGCHGTHVHNVTVKDDMVFGIHVDSSDDVVVKDSRILNMAGNSLEVFFGSNFTLENNVMNTAGKARQIQA